MQPPLFSFLMRHTRTYWPGSKDEGIWHCTSSKTQILNAIQPSDLPRDQYMYLSTGENRGITTQCWNCQSGKLWYPPSSSPTWCSLIRKMFPKCFQKHILSANLRLLECFQLPTKLQWQRCIWVNTPGRRFHCLGRKSGRISKNVWIGMVIKMNREASILSFLSWARSVAARVLGCMGCNYEY